MTTKVNGSPEQGVWFERDVQFLEINSDEADFATGDFGVSGPIDKVIQVMQTRGTVIGISREDDNNLHVIYGHAGGSFLDEGTTVNNIDVLAELKAELEALDVVDGTITVTLGTGWTTITA
tara:strand:- start:1708 stop:2070 length:363 start_codon:yes stop_codon:yes gene_type:complete